MGVFQPGFNSSAKMTLGKYLDAIKFTLWTLLSIAFLTSYRYEVKTLRGLNSNRPFKVE